MRTQTPQSSTRPSPDRAVAFPPWLTSSVHRLRCGGTGSLRSRSCSPRLWLISAVVGFLFGILRLAVIVVLAVSRSSAGSSARRRAVSDRPEVVTHHLLDAHSRVAPRPLLAETFHQRHSVNARAGIVIDLAGNDEHGHTCGRRPLRHPAHDLSLERLRVEETFAGDDEVGALRARRRSSTSSATRSKPSINEPPTAASPPARPPAAPEPSSSRTSTPCSSRYTWASRSRRRRSERDLCARRALLLGEQIRRVDERRANVARDLQLDAAQPLQGVDGPQRAEAAVGRGRSADADDDAPRARIERGGDQLAGAVGRRRDRVVAVGAADELEARRQRHLDDGSRCRSAASSAAPDRRAARSRASCGWRRRARRACLRRRRPTAPRRSPSRRPSPRPRWRRRDLGTRRRCHGTCPGRRRLASAHVVCSLVPERPVVIVSNRGPLSFRRDDDGGSVQTRGRAGSVSGLAPLVAGTDATWLAAAPMSDADREAAAAGDVAEADGLARALAAARRRRVPHGVRRHVQRDVVVLHHGLYDLPAPAAVRPRAGGRRGRRTGR